MIFLPFSSHNRHIKTHLIVQFFGILRILMMYIYFMFGQLPAAPYTSNIHVTYTVREINTKSSIINTHKMKALYMYFKAL